MESIDYFVKEGSFKGKNIVITGATGGIGSILTDAFLKSGARVTAIGRNEKKLLDKFKFYLKNPNFDYEIINLENPLLINRGFKNIMVKLKGRIDSLIMCHGQFKVGRLMETGVDIFDTTLNVNVRSCFHFISVAAPFLKLTKGNVVAISSVDAKIPVRDSFLNSISKSMLESLIQSSALELASFDVRINGVAPGITYTNHRVTDVFSERDNRDYLEKMGGFFLLNKEVIKIIFNY